MRRLTAMLSTVAVVMMAAGLVAQAKPNFAGKWTRDLTASPLPAPGGGGRGGGGGGALGTDVTISQDAATLTLEYMSGGQAPAPVKLVYKLDGTESKNTTMGRGGQPTEQTAKAIWDADKLVVTTTTAFGEQKRSFSLEGGNLIVETTAPGRDGGPGTPTKVVYKKAA